MIFSIQQRIFLFCNIALQLTIMSGRFVAATTVTLTSGSMPSNSFKSWDKTRSATEVPPSPFSPLLTVKASISSCGGYVGKEITLKY
jgi:hypothetical protein